jgi:hypothetical protein
MIAGLGRPGRRRGPAAGSRDVDRAAFSLQPLSRRRAPGPVGGYGRRGALRAILRSGVIAQRALLAAGRSMRPALTSDGMGGTVASGDGRRSGNGSGGAVLGSGLDAAGSGMGVLLGSGARRSALGDRRKRPAGTLRRTIGHAHALADAQQRGRQPSALAVQG